MSIFKKANIFTFLMVIIAFAFALRLVNLADISTPASIAQDTPPPQKFEEVTEQPPPMPGKQDAAAAADKPPQTGTDIAIDKVPPPATSAYGEPSFSASEIGVLQSLAKRRDELDKREQKIGQQEALLKAAGVEVDKKIAELNKIRGELEDLLGKQKVAEDERVNSLVKIYENMKPKEAARIFDTLEMNVLLSVIGKMSERKTSPILASMDPEKARQVTIQLSQQRKLPELQEAVKKVAPAPTATP